MPAQPRQRLFFALWPPQSIRQRLWQVSEGLPLPSTVRRTVPANLHLTLLFLGSVTSEQRQCLQNLSSPMSIKRFELIIDSVGTWQRPGILWLGSSRWLPALADLAAALGQHAGDCGIDLEEREFVPHITIARNSSGPVADNSKLEANSICRWPVDGFSLMRSVSRPQAVVYEEIKSWRLISD